MKEKKELVFTKYIPRFSATNSTGLHLNKGNINIGKQAYEELGSPNSVDIYYDVKNRAIQLKPSRSLDSRKIHRRGFCIPLAKLMPQGRYKYWKDGIFIMEGVV